MWGGIAKFEVVACTLRARDWKGLDNYGSNAVIVIKRKLDDESGYKCQYNKYPTDN